MSAWSPDDALCNGVRVAYIAGQIGERSVPDYTASLDIAPDSRTDTYASRKSTVGM